MASRLGLDTCRHHHDAHPVYGFADATIIATGDAVETTLLKGFDAYAAAVAETIKTLDGRYVSKKHHTLLPRGENYLHGLSDHVSGLLVAASQCAPRSRSFPRRAAVWKSSRRRHGDDFHIRSSRRSTECPAAGASAPSTRRCGSSRR